MHTVICTHFHVSYVSRCKGSAMFGSGWVSEPSGVALSCFAFSNSTVFTDALPVRPEGCSSTLLKAILYSAMSWVSSSVVNCGSIEPTIGGGSGVGLGWLCCWTCWSCIQPVYVLWLLLLLLLLLRLAGNSQWIGNSKSFRVYHVYLEAAVG